jgi:hypothetical protein
MSASCEKRAGERKRLPVRCRLRKGRPMKTRKAGIAIIFLAVMMTAGLMLVLPGCGGTKSVADVWQKMLEADNTITSMSMKVAISYENAQIGSGQVEAESLDISGDNVHFQRVVLGQNYIEVIRVNGKQYARTGNDQWQEVTLSISNQSALQETGPITNLPNLASSSENLGVETIDGKSAYHLTFTVDPANVGSVFSSVPAAELAQNQGAQVDVWVDTDNYFRIRYEALIKNVKITDAIGFVDLRIVNTVSMINENITINSPI